MSTPPASSSGHPAHHASSGPKSFVPGGTYDPAGPGQYKQFEAAEHMKTTEADSIARDHISKAGYGAYFGHSLGHGIGLAPHEKPTLAPLKPKLLREGMVFTVEPGIYIPGKGGVRLEEMVILGRDGAELITTNKDFYSF